MDKYHSEPSSTITPGHQQWDKTLSLRALSLPPDYTTAGAQGNLGIILAVGVTVPNPPFSHDDFVTLFKIISGPLNSDDADRCYKATQDGRYYEAFKTILEEYGLRPLNNIATRSPIVTHWGDPYIGDTFNAFKNALRDRMTSVPSLYAKSLFILQSSGSGKSRLIQKCGEGTITVMFVLRPSEATGVPPADPDIRNFLLIEKEDLNHAYAVVIALLVGTVRIMYEHFSNLYGPKNPEDWNTLMGLITPDSTSGYLYRRSDFKHAFCQSVLQYAEQLVPEVISKLENNHSVSTVCRELLFHLVKTLCGGHYPHDIDLPKFLIAFDEVSTAWNGLTMTAMERVLHELVDFSLWTLFLTKNYPLYSPPVRTQATDASTRLGEPRYIRPRPFVAFDFDIHDIARLNEEPILQLQKPMLEHAKVDHISAYGRPLWWTHHEKPYEDIHLFVDSKLMAGQSFNPRVFDHAFAAVSFRVLLEPTWSDILSWQLALTAVELHLRLVVSIDIERGMIRTASGSEPIVADAAQHQLCRTPRSWQKALRTLWDDLFSQGRIAKGEKGELLARILLVLARDMTVRRVDLPHAIGSAPVGDPGLKDEYMVPSCFPVTAWEFLTALLGDKLEETLDCAARSSERSNRVSKPYFEDAKIDFKAFLKKGYINLNHMTTTSMPLSEGCMNFLNLLLRRGAAVQLGSGWSYWDILIPMYVGDPSEPFDPFKVTAIAIQVNKRSQPEAVFEGKDLERFFFVKDAHYVHLHLDLGQESASGVSKSRFYRFETSVVLDLHVEGHDKRTYPPLGHFGVDSIAKKMMESTRLSEDEHILGDTLKGCNAYTGKPYDIFSGGICKELAKASDKDTEDISDESGSLHMEQD